MKFIVVLFLITILFGCTDNTSGNKSSHKNKPDSDTLSESIPVIVTTAMPIICQRNYDPPFYLDSILIDSTVLAAKNDSFPDLNLYFNSYFPQSNDVAHSAMNYKIRGMVKDYFSKHESEPGNDLVSVNAGIWIDGFSFEKNFVSIIFQEQDYYHGAAHYNHGYISFNYDLKKNKEIRLTDFILFKPGEAQKFCDAFNPDPTLDSDERHFLRAADFFSDRPFYLDYNEIVICFNDYEKGPSMTKIRVPYSKIKGYVNPEYRILFE